MRYLAEHKTELKDEVYFWFVSARAEGLQCRLRSVDVAVSDNSRDVCVTIILGLGYCLRLIRVSINSRLNLV